MIIGIDASNIRVGGGLNHLVETLRVATPRRYGVNEIVVWSGRATLDRIAGRPWLYKVHEPALDRSFVRRLAWQVGSLPGRVRQRGCDVLFSPGGWFSGTFQPLVSFSQNLLPFDARERKRFGAGLNRARYHLLERGQSRTFCRSEGVIFLTHTARRVVEQRVARLPDQVAVIPYGIHPRFRCEPRPAAPLAAYTVERPFQWLYVSPVKRYKHQDQVVRAVGRLRNAGLPVVLDLVGSGGGAALRALRETLREVDPQGSFVRYRGHIPHQEIERTYRNADGFVFASTCETFGQVLLEAMSAGLPVACSDRSAIPEVVGPAGRYFDPETPVSIADALHDLMRHPARREALAWQGYERARSFSWERCANDTLQFIVRVARRSARAHRPAAHGRPAELAG